MTSLRARPSWLSSFPQGQGKHAETEGGYSKLFKAAGTEERSLDVYIYFW